ncbi:MAG: GAF domain-containing protein [Candidatus Acidiferrum sp.]
MERISRASEESRRIWLKAQLAGRDATHTRQTASAQVEELAHDREFRRRYRDKMLARILHAAITGTRAGMGNIQLFDRPSRLLRLHISEGFASTFLFHCSSITPGHGVCGLSAQTRSRVVVEDVTDSSIFLRHPILETILDAGVRAVQSTPLVSSRGHVLGVFSTHHKAPHRPSVRDLQTIDYFAQWAATLLEWHDSPLHPRRDVAKSRNPRLKSK